MIRHEFVSFFYPSRYFIYNGINQNSHVGFWNLVFFASCYCCCWSRFFNHCGRRGEEHSFILKPATTFWKQSKGHNDKNLRLSRLPAGNAASNWNQSSNTELKLSRSPTDQYAVLVSCRCNYTGIKLFSHHNFHDNLVWVSLLISVLFYLHYVESKLFFKQPTSWRPRISRDLMISVASEMSKQIPGSDGTDLPVQVIFEIN